MLARRLHGHLRWHNPSARHPDVLAPSGPWEVSDNGTGLATRYKSNGMGLPPVVTIPLPGGGPGGAPTGNVFTGTSDFAVSLGGASGPSQFIFATEDGAISGWNPSVDLTNAIIAVDRSTVRQGKLLGAVYKGWPSGRTALPASCSPRISASEL